MHRALLLSASLSALAATTAVAQGAPTLRIVAETPLGAKGDKPRIAVLELQAFKWGSASSAIELEPVKITSYQLGAGGADSGRINKVEGVPMTHKTVEGRGMNELSMDEKAGKERTAQKDMSVKGQTIKQNSQPYGGFAGGVRVAPGDVDGSTIGANETITVGGARTGGSSMETMKKAWRESSQPLAKGSVWIRVASPWAGCRVGAIYPRLELADGGRTYVLEDVRVTSCGSGGDADDRPTEEVAFYYNKIGH